MLIYVSPNLFADNPSAVGVFARDHLPFPLVNYKRTLAGNPVAVLDRSLANRGGVCFALVVKGFSSQLKRDIAINEEGKNKRVYRIDNTNVGVIIEVGDGIDFTEIDRLNRDSYATNSFYTKNQIHVQARLTPVLLTTTPYPVHITIPRIPNAAQIEVVRASYARPSFEKSFSHFKGFKGSNQINLSLAGFSSPPQTCTIISQNNIVLKLPTVAAKDIKAGKRYGGKFNIRMNCPKDVNGKYISTYITFSDASDPSNRSNILSLTKDSSAKEVGI